MFEVPVLHGFIEEANEVVQRAQRRENRYSQQIFTSLCFGTTKKPIYRLVMITGTGGSESEVRQVRPLFSLHLSSARDVEDTEIGFMQYVDITPPLDQYEQAVSCVILR